MQDVNDGSFPMSSSADQKKCCLFISRIALNITNAVFKWTSQAHIWPQDKDKDSRRWDKSHVSCISPPGIICQYVYVLFVRIDLAYFSVWQFFNNTWIHTLIAEPLCTLEESNQFAAATRYRLSCRFMSFCELICPPFYLGWFGRWERWHRTQAAWNHCADGDLWFVSAPF